MLFDRKLVFTSYWRWSFVFSSHILHRKSTIKQKIHLNRRKYEYTTEIWIHYIYQAGTIVNFFLTYIPWLWSRRNHGVSSSFSRMLGVTVHCEGQNSIILFIIFWHVRPILDSHDISFPWKNYVVLWLIIWDVVVFPFFGLVDMSFT